MNATYVSAINCYRPNAVQKVSILISGFKERAYRSEKFENRVLRRLCGNETE